MAYPTEYEALEPYDFLMGKVVNLKQESDMNINPKDFQIQVEELMNMIAWHESARTMDPSIKQKSNVYSEEDPERVVGSKEGPGRGLYQYELETLDGSGAGRTAMNNLLKGYSDKKGQRTTEGYNKLPKWAKQYFDTDNPSEYPNPKGDVDFSELTKEQQDILFLADKLMGTAKIGDIGEISNAEWWAKYHHKGGGDTAPFDTSRQSYINR